MLRRLLIGLGVAIGGLVLLFVALTGASAILRAQSRQLPAPTGPHAVGRLEIALSDAGRLDPFATDGRSRDVAVWIWYPASGQSATGPAPYVPAAWADAVHEAAGFVGLFTQSLHAVKTNSHAGAPAIVGAPVVVLLPGLGMAVPSYSALAEDLASHGYAVVGINMTESSIVGFPDGHVVGATAAGGVDASLASDVDSWYGEANRVIDVWVEDAAFVVTELAADPPGIGPLDFRRVAYVGHSLGGAASFERCSHDEHCVGAVDLDGTLFSEVGQTGMAPPGLVIRAAVGPTGEFATRAAASFAQVQISGSVRIVTMEGAAHNNFTDDGVLYGPLYRPLGLLGSIDGARALTITRDVVRAFLDQHLRRAGSRELDSTISAYPELVGD